MALGVPWCALIAGLAQASSNDDGERKAEDDGESGRSEQGKVWKYGRSPRANDMKIGGGKKGERITARGIVKPHRRLGSRRKGDNCDAEKILVHRLPPSREIGVSPNANIIRLLCFAVPPHVDKTALTIFATSSVPMQTAHQRCYGCNDRPFEVGGSPPERVSNGPWGKIVYALASAESPVKGRTIF